MRDTVDFFVFGVPKPGGSKRAFMVGKKGMPKRPVLVDMANNGDWKTAVRETAATRFKEPVAWSAIGLEVTFLMPRPKYHFNKRGSIKLSAPFWHSSTPDCTKLLRALEDALKGIAWIDDSRVVWQLAEKMYAIGPCGASVKIKQIAS